MWIYFSLLVLGTFFIADSTLTPTAHAEEYFVNIPFGAFNPELNTPAEVWFDPPVLQIHAGDTITWYNDDGEGHTVTSGEGSGRFGWMDTKDLGVSNGIFDSKRFMSGDSWEYTFENTGTFDYFCVIHPWMAGVILVESIIPDYPHDAAGNPLEFPLLQYTPDKLIEFDITWEPNVIKTFEKTKFIYQTYDAQTNSNLDKMKYDLIITQNNKIIFQDFGITQVGGDYRNFIFEDAGPIEIRFQNIVSVGTSGIESSVRGTVENPIFRTVVFNTIVYDNSEKTSADEMVIQPARRMDIYYEILVGTITIPAVMLVIIVLYMKYRKPSKTIHSEKKSTAV